MTLYSVEIQVTVVEAESGQQVGRTIATSIETEAEIAPGSDSIARAMRISLNSILAGTGAPRAMLLRAAIMSHALIGRPEIQRATKVAAAAVRGLASTVEAQITRFADTAVHEVNE